MIVALSLLVTTMCVAQLRIKGHVTEKNVASPVVNATIRMPDGKTVNKWGLQFYSNVVGTPLYKSPPAQRKPLTRNQVKKLITATGYDTASPQERTDFINGIRHAEAAHGIKENT